MPFTRACAISLSQSWLSDWEEMQSLPSLLLYLFVHSQRQGDGATATVAWVERLIMDYSENLRVRTSNDTHISQEKDLYLNRSKYAKSTSSYIWRPCHCLHVTVTWRQFPDALWTFIHTPFLREHFKQLEVLNGFIYPFSLSPFPRHATGWWKWNKTFHSLLLPLEI